MNISKIFEEVAKVKYEYNKYSENIRKNDVIGMYTQMMMSDYIISQDTLLEVSGTVDFFYDKKEINDIKLNKNNYKYLVYTLTGHNGEWKIIEFDNLIDIEKYILGPGGILNMFTTEIIVMDNLKNIKYKVYEVLQDGREKEVFDFEDCTLDIEPNLIIKWITKKKSL